jgi:hypothetical protein
MKRRRARTASMPHIERRYGVSEDRLVRIEMALAELPTKADVADLRNAIAPALHAARQEILSMPLLFSRACSFLLWYGL